MVTPSTWVVIPTYNEVQNLEPLLESLLARPDLGVWGVDDASTDGTAAQWAEWAYHNPDRVRVLHRPGKWGLGSAYRQVFTHPDALHSEWLVQMDADGSHQVADLDRLLAQRGHADLVIGSRYVPGGSTPGWPLSRQLLSRTGSWYARAMLALPIRDVTGGFKCWRTAFLQRLPLQQVEAQGYGFQIALTAWAVWMGGVIRETPITFVERQSGISKMSPAIVREAIRLVWTLRARHETWRLSPEPCLPASQVEERL